MLIILSMLMIFVLFWTTLIFAAKTRNLVQRVSDSWGKNELMYDGEALCDDALSFCCLVVSFMIVFMLLSMWGFLS